MVNGVGDVFSGVVLVQVWVDGWNGGLCSSDCCLTMFCVRQCWYCRDNNTQFLP
jgi:hypothetical protein